MKRFVVPAIVSCVLALSFLSTADAQLTLTNGCAAIGLQFVRSSTYMKPFLLAWIITFRTWPPIWRSASTCSSVPSTSYTSLGVYWK